MESYTFRPSAFEKEKTLTLTDHDLLISEGDNLQKKISYTDIQQINPLFVSTKHNHNAYQTNLVLVSGQRIVIKNKHYKGFANLQNISHLYTPFIKALHEKVAAKNPLVNCKKGINDGVYTLYVAFFYFMMAVFAAASFFLMISLQIVMGIIVLGLGYLVWVSMRRYNHKNKPQNYEPFAIPPEILP